ncbi:MAG: DUF4491 family protein [Bacteroidales bacterium]|nr:DUF4491 family protein [Bacteroidales bacterium]
MNFSGIAIGLATFLIIGICHPIVIKAEYHFGKGCWWAFLLAGLAFSAVSLALTSVIWSTVAGVAAFSSFWSILELFEQEKRVEKGWFPENPKRRKEQNINN